MAKTDEEIVLFEDAYTRSSYISYKNEQGKVVVEQYLTGKGEWEKFAEYKSGVVLRGFITSDDIIHLDER